MHVPQIRRYRLLLLAGQLLFSWDFAAFSNEASTTPSSALTNHVTASLVAPGIRNARVHDPSTIIRCKDEFWIFSTGRGVPSLRSTDLITWAQGPAVFTNPPAWVAATVPENRDMRYWAPDLTCIAGHYLLYYSVSTFGKQVSAIGLATTPTLDSSDPAYSWSDQGIVMVSGTNDSFNAIDPAVFHDHDGSLWLAFGSFWSGIKMVQLDPASGKRITPNSPVYSLAYHDSIEASYLFQRDAFYYLFVNWGLCCRGTRSTYRICVGRSRSVTGPYLDIEGKNMLDGGGTLFLDTTRPYVGPGHAGIILDKGNYWFSCHYEGIESTNSVDNAQRRGAVLAVLPLEWTADNWPAIGNQTSRAH